MRPAILAELLERAAGPDEPFGVWIGTTNPKALGNQLHMKRQELNLPEVMICVPSVEKVLILIKRSVELNP